MVIHQLSDVHIFVHMLQQFICLICAEIVVSGGMSMPQILSTLDPRTTQLDRIRPVRS